MATTKVALGHELRSCQHSSTAKTPQGLAAHR
jgi:hypothetical protein